MVAVCAMSSCCKESHYIIPREVKLKNVTLECVNEVDGVKDPTSGIEYTQHSFHGRFAICRNRVSGSATRHKFTINDNNYTQKASLMESLFSKIPMKSAFWDE